MKHSCSVCAAEPSDGERWLIEFDHYLDHAAGLARRTRVEYLRYAGRLVKYRFGSASVDWSRLRADELSEFVRKEISRLSVGYPRGPVIATRALLRFLVQRGVVAPGLTGAVPRVRQWKLASLPRLVPAEQLRSAIDSCRPGTRCGSRDRALILLLSRLGLRVGETVALELCDINWREGIVSIRAGKFGRQRDLPLPRDVGEALVAYLRKGRPESSYPVLFLRSLPPIGPLSVSAVSVMIKRRLRRAGLSTRGVAAHALRHTAATQMVRRGATFKDVADVLGHRHLVTTHIYAKLDIKSLATVTLAWPGGSR